MGATNHTFHTWKDTHPHILLCNPKNTHHHPQKTVVRQLNLRPPPPTPKQIGCQHGRKSSLSLDSALSANDIEGGERLWVLCSLKSVNGKAPGHVGDSR
ncbi:hypothetical protein CEXT_587711 [Caerostris extrusa]|uniref:Uncharacterized protein n=1 Tax=Caerostris extrusa TaxID=172846 RepID=A0AAV4PVB1_CAEEX|nr:hypothetical protein CEXT_587711 [Caerostris extrusa]